MKPIVRAMLIAAAATAAAAAVTVLVRRRPALHRLASVGDALYVEADLLTEEERQALRSELEGMV
jgi:hypothetical protein